MSKSSGISLIPLIVLAVAMYTLFSDGDEKEQTVVDDKPSIQQQLGETIDDLKQEASKLKEEALKLKKEVMGSFTNDENDEDEQMEKETKELEAKVQEELNETEAEIQQEEDEPEEPIEGRQL